MLSPAISHSSISCRRSQVGLFGIPSEFHLQPIKCLSDGLKTRLVFCEISMNKPHILLLDEPTNASGESGYCMRMGFWGILSNQASVTTARSATTFTLLPLSPSIFRTLHHRHGND